MRADLTIAQNGKARCVILRQAGATAPEIKAVEELARLLEQITGAKFEVQDAGTKIPERAIIVGRGMAAEFLFPEISFDTLEPDEIVMRVKGNKLLLSGGRPRGTIYAVYRFLQKQCDVRWWASWANTIPKKSSLKIPELNVRYVPPFEYRGPYWFPGFEPKWKVHNQANDQTWEIPAELGGCVKYKGYSHTFYPLVPPEKHFAEHPEWFSMINGQRTTNRAQLCLTSPQLRDFVVQRVKEWLRESPDAHIISVTQNDWNGWCECLDCKALDDAEGSHAGTMLTFANYVAEKIEPEFPNVAVDTFAYTYTRTPPKTLKARRDVIVRLCSIECNFREPLDHPSNAAFADDIRKWSKICSRLYVWDYTTDFKNYVHPHPNWFTLGSNVRFFQQNGVKGVFEQGAYAGHGAEMAEMRAWVLAQLLWNPQQDARALIKEFLNGYYGREAGKLIYQYFELVHESSAGLFLGCYLRKEPPTHLRFSILAQAEQLWQQAEKMVEYEWKKNPRLRWAVCPNPYYDEWQDRLWRVRIAHLPVRYAFLRNWNWLRHDCWERNEKWPLPESRKTVAEEFRAVCAGVDGKEWTRVKVLSERGLTVEDFLKEFGDDSLKQLGPPPPVRLKNPPPPSDLSGVDPKLCIELQDNVASLARPGKWAQILPDESASDHRAVWMPGDHSECVSHFRQFSSRESPIRHMENLCRNSGKEERCCPGCVSIHRVRCGSL
ncbi:MAG: DUF4838 domain-containing protein [Verrucomicrobiota bacterium]